MSEHGTTRRELARCREFDFGIEDHGFPYLFGHFDYGGSGSQGFGAIADLELLQRFLGVFRAEKLGDIEGRVCWVTHDYGRIYRVEPQFEGEGTPLDMEAWAALPRELEHAQHAMLRQQEKAVDALRSLESAESELSVALLYVRELVRRAVAGGEGESRG